MVFRVPKSIWHCFSGLTSTMALQLNPLGSGVSHMVRPGWRLGVRSVGTRKVSEVGGRE